MTLDHHHHQPLSKLVLVITLVLYLLHSSHFVQCAEAEGKAIYSSSPTHNPISTYFKEQKNKLRPYFATRPGGTDGLDLSDLYPEELTVHDDAQAAHSSYYDGGGGGTGGAASLSPSPYHDNLPSYSIPTQEDHHNNYLNLNPYDLGGSPPASSDGHAESSNAMYSVVDPHGYPSGSSPLSAPYSSGNPGGYFSGGDPSQYIQPPSFHSPGLPGSGSGGYYGGGGGHHDNSIYSQPPPPQGYYGNSGGGGGGGASSPPASSSPHHHHGSPPASNADKSNDNLAASSNHVDSPTDTYTYPPGGDNGGAGSNGEYQSGMIMDDDLIDMEEQHPQISPPDYSPYDYMAPDDELFAAPGDDAGSPGAAAANTGAGSSGTAAAATSDTPAQPAPENPLNFLNLVGTDFQPGRLVNIFFGLFIMLFMIIFHGYALWILGIAYLPGTRSLGSSSYEMNWDKVNEACELVLDALEYWENKLEEK